MNLRERWSKWWNDLIEVHQREMPNDPLYPGDVLAALADHNYEPIDIDAAIREMRKHKIPNTTIAMANKLDGERYYGWNQGIENAIIVLRTYSNGDD